VRFDLHAMMTNFMGGFFVIFSFFKLLDLKGFAEGYSTYDLIGARFRGYGYIYPFLELGLGILYLVGSAPVTTNILTAILMAVSSIGVLKTIRENRPFQCACLGTIFKLPLTKITLAEDLLMLIMALVMLIIPAAY
ncbi:MAG: copper chaperone, partial [Deltaproteobacteria bacterium]|nr:copper chaperone [Deltaproteobacteria bacterium]